MFKFRHVCKPSLFSYEGDDGDRYADCVHCYSPVKVLLDPDLLSKQDQQAAAKTAVKSCPTFKEGVKQKYNYKKIREIVRGQGESRVKIFRRAKG